jgi:hypothetical protein
MGRGPDGTYFSPRFMAEPNIIDQPAAATVLTAPQAEDARISDEFRKSIQRTLQEKQKQRSTKPGKRAKFDIQLDRHEAKYVISNALVPEIRSFIRPFCEPDPYAHGDPPVYVILTLQLDNDRFSFHNAKELEAPARFKLRVRTYGEPGNSPVFLEVKRKIRGAIVKTRAKVPFDEWSRELLYSTLLTLPFKSRSEETAFLEFSRLVRETGAHPIVLVRYVRESYFGVHDSYARVTFDRNLQYQPTRSWTDWGRSGRWLAMDTSLIQKKGNTFSGVVLELKTLSDAPQWMIDLVEHFNLERTGHCKYSNAVWHEAIFTGEPEMPSYVSDLLEAY